MPMYEYECEACGHRFERIQRFSDPLVEVCPKCGERKVQKLVSSPAIQFKGSGWYVTDYAGKSGGGAKEKDSTKAESKDSKDSKDSSTDAKPATTESKSTTTPKS